MDPDPTGATFHARNHDGSQEACSSGSDPERRGHSRRRPRPILASMTGLIRITDQKTKQNSKVTFTLVTFTLKKQKPLLKSHSPRDRRGKCSNIFWGGDNISMETQPLVRTGDQTSVSFYLMVKQQVSHWNSGSGKSILNTSISFKNTVSAESWHQQSPWYTLIHNRM